MAGESLEPKKSTDEWPQEALLDRIESCRAMLHVHDFLSESENRKVQERIRKWVEAKGK